MESQTNQQSERKVASTEAEEAEGTELIGREGGAARRTGDSQLTSKSLRWSRRNLLILTGALVLLNHRQRPTAHSAGGLAEVTWFLFR